MIEKLELPSSARLVCGKDYDLAFKYIKQTVNQLVDAVNGLQEAFESIHPCFNYKDKLKWIGRRCNFSNDCENWIEDIFVNIDRTDLEPEIPKYRALNGELYRYCKLVTEPEPAENVQPDAESRPENVHAVCPAVKYMGKVCRFWNGGNGKKFKNIGVLIEILSADNKRRYTCASKPKKHFEFCEPVKPDDSIIYKGE